jgi:hypothetical protein
MNTLAFVRCPGTPWNWSSSAHYSVKALEADGRSWIQAWNQDPTPFVWTKTADEILDSLTVYWGRIGDSGH